MLLGQMTFGIFFNVINILSLCHKRTSQTHKRSTDVHLTRFWQNKSPPKTSTWRLGKQYFSIIQLFQMIHDFN